MSFGAPTLERDVEGLSRMSPSGAHGVVGSDGAGALRTITSALYNLVPNPENWESDRYEIGIGDEIRAN